jgi:hypothetical protein
VVPIGLQDLFVPAFDNDEFLAMAVHKTALGFFQVI